MSTAVLAVSTLQRYVAALLALRLIEVTGKRSAAWIPVPLAMMLMAVRRTITLSRALSGAAPAPGCGWCRGYRSGGSHSRPALPSAGRPGRAPSAIHTAVDRIPDADLHQCLRHAL